MLSDSQRPLVRCVGALAVAFALTTPCARAQAGDAVFGIVGTHQLTTYRPAPPVLPFPSLINLGEDADSYFSLLIPGSDEYVAPLEVDELVALLYPWFEDLCDNGDIEPRENNTLFVRAPRATVQDVSDVVAHIAALAAPTLAIEAVLIRHDGTLSPPPILDRAQADALFASPDIDWREAGSTTHGLGLGLGAHAMHSYRRESYIEVAESAGIMFPRQSRFFDGVALSILPHITGQADRVVLQVQFALGRTLGVEELQHDVAGVPTIDRPILQSTTGSMAGAVANGGAIVLRTVAADRLGGNLVLAVRCTAPERPGPLATAPDLGIFPASALTMEGGYISPMWHEEQLRTLTSMDGEMWSIDEQEVAVIDASELEDLIRNTIDPDAWDDTATLYSTYRQIFVAAPEATRKKVQQTLAFFEQRYLRNTEVSVSHGADGPTLSLPTLVGRAYALRHGVESTATDGVEVEIAKKKSLARPTVRDTFDGIAFRVRPQSDNQQISAALQWLEEAVPGDAAASELPTTRIRSRSHYGPMPDNGLATGRGLFGDQTWHVRAR